MPGQSPTITPGGRAIPYYASIRFKVNRKEFLFDSKKNVIGVKIKVAIVKNKVGGSPFGDIDLNIYYNKGYDIKDELVEVLIELGIVESRGAWTYYKDSKWNGVKAFTADIHENEELYQDLLSQYHLAISQRESIIIPTEIEASLESEEDSE